MLKSFTVEEVDQFNSIREAVVSDGDHSKTTAFLRELGVSIADDAGIINNILPSLCHVGKMAIENADFRSRYLVAALKTGLLHPSFERKSSGAVLR